MSADVESVLAEARQLLAADKAKLLSALYDLVVPAAPEWEVAWDRECSERLTAYRCGELDAIDSQQAMEALRRKHGLN
jgi:hypothetical protein